MVLADNDYLVKEKSVLQLLVHIQQPLLHPKLIEIAESYKIEDHMNLYGEKDAVLSFLKLWKADLLLKRGEVFTPLDDEHLRQAIYLFDMFYFAKDWETAYKTAVWARQYVNEGLFAYAFTTYLRTTRSMILPPLYEIVPHMFVRSETMQKAYETRLRTGEKIEKDIVILSSNFSNWIHHKMSPEMRMAYFTEDLSLNEWNMEMTSFWPWWMMAKHERYSLQNERHGERMFYNQRQILARYQLERLTNNLEEMKTFDWDDHKMTGYAPHLRYKNGKEMPMRPTNMKMTDDDEMWAIKNMEERIQTGIDSGFFVSENGKLIKIQSEGGIEILSRIIEETMDEINPKMYGSLLRKLVTLVGRIVDPHRNHDMAPGALMHWETQLRDPMYYSILARVHELYLRHKSTLPSYKREELLFNGVSIETLEVEKLITFFENVDVEINNGIDVSALEDDKKVNIVARQSRINYKPFTYRAMINSEKATPAVVRLFIGPKRDSNGMEMNMRDRAPFMFELDRFAVELTAGKNKIERSSTDFSMFEGDKLSFRSLYKKIEDAIQGKSTFNLDQVN